MTDGEYFYEYKGARSTADIVEYMKKIEKSASNKYGTLKKLAEHLNNVTQNTVVGIFTKSHDHHKLDLLKKFDYAADKLRFDVPFVHIRLDNITAIKRLKLLKDLEIDASKVVIVRAEHLRSKFEKNYAEHKEGSVMDFVKKNLHGLVGVRTIQNRLDFNVRD